MKIPISDLKELAKKRELTHIVVYGYDGKEQHIATYGNTVEACSQVADWGNRMKDVLGWPESLKKQPSRVKKLEKRIKELEFELLKWKGGTK